MRRPASASRTYGRYAVGPFGPILDPDASPRRAHKQAKNHKIKISTTELRVDRPRPFRNDCLRLGAWMHAQPRGERGDPAVIYRIFSVAFGIMPMVILLEIGTAESRACGRSYST